MSRPFYETVYHCNGWTLADAFRPQPGWGSRAFTVPASVLEGWDDAALIAGAKECAPEGYRLTKLSIHPVEGGERIIWSTAPDPRFNRASTAQETGRGG